MRKLKWPLLRPLFFIILSTLLLLSCGCSIFDGTAGSSSSPQTSTAPSPSPTEAPEKSIEGILTEYTGSLLSIETEDGEEYSFAVTGLTLSGLPNAKAGDSFTVWYQGTLDTTKKQQTVTVTRAEKTEDGFAAFSVRDNGQGISPALLPHLFDYSIRHASPPTGDGKRNMGLGLSVCSAVVKAHGGRLTAHNHPDGAEFIFCLPMPPADPAISTDLSEEETL